MDKQYTLTSCYMSLLVSFSKLVSIFMVVLCVMLNGHYDKLVENLGLFPNLSFKNQAYFQMYPSKSFSKKNQDQINKK